MKLKKPFLKTQLCQNTWDKHLQRRKGLFWLRVSEVQSMVACPHFGSEFQRFSPWWLVPILAQSFRGSVHGGLSPFWLRVSGVQSMVACPHFGSEFQGFSPWWLVPILAQSFRGSVHGGLSPLVWTCSEWGLHGRAMLLISLGPGSKESQNKGQGCAPNDLLLPTGPPS
jgi:hypothetical protein